MVECPKTSVEESGSQKGQKHTSTGVCSTFHSASVCYYDYIYIYSSNVFKKEGPRTSYMQILKQAQRAVGQRFFDRPCRQTAACDELVNLC